MWIDLHMYFSCRLSGVMPSLLNSLAFIPKTEVTNDRGS